ncbi:hypothetical protein H8356DRAFT_1706697 [Neocallimastix lanati (nom. inval.)]|nr:hypothetical protein H8356DRAFT_1706697 [Neocallimastix sp. JGI-2020a]
MLQFYFSKRGWDKQYYKIYLSMLSMLIGNFAIYIFGFSWFVYIYKIKDFWVKFTKGYFFIY